MKPASSFWSGGDGRSAAVGCLSRIILCFRPLCSFDERKIAIDAPPGPRPGVVATLMGLDSLPRAPVSFNTPRRSYVPAYRQLEDDNFFILSFDNSRSTRKPSSSSSTRGIKDNEILRLKKTATYKLVKKDCSSEKTTLQNENSSPNSVVDQESASPGEVSRLRNSKKRRPLSLYDRRKMMMDIKGENRVGDCSERLGEEVGKMRSSWLNDETLLQHKHCFMEIGTDLESNIFDHLLQEIVVD